jgi:hypothetical protein
VFREHFLACFIEDAAGRPPARPDRPDIVCVETDYPHSDSTWPESPERLAGHLGHLDDETIDAITHRNAMRHFGFDPFAHIAPADATVAALRAKATHVDVGPCEPRRPFVAPDKPLTLTDMLMRAASPPARRAGRSRGRRRALTLAARRGGSSPSALLAPVLCAVGRAVPTCGRRVVSRSRTRGAAER